MLGQLRYISILEQCVQSFGEDAQLVSGNANRFVGESLVTFERISMMVVTRRFETLSAFVGALRVPFLSILGWCHRSVNAGTRLRAREVLDMITAQIEQKKPIAGLSLCREALDAIYMHKAELAERFAFNPARYTENVIEGGWRGASSLSLFEIQCKLESGGYPDVDAFAQELMRLGAEYSGGAESDPLHEYAQFIVQVASGLTAPPQSKSYANSLSGQDTADASEFARAATASGCVKSLAWRMFATDHGSPIWRLEWHGGRESDPYMIHVRKLVTAFEEWARDVPLCTEMVLATKRKSDEAGWMASAVRVKGGFTLNEWNDMRRRSELLIGVARLLCSKIEVETADEKSELMRVNEALMSYGSPSMSVEMMDALAHAWSSFLYFERARAMDRQRKSNFETIKRMRHESHRPLSSKSAITTAIYLHVRDVTLLHNREFLRFWANVPTYDAAKALAEFDEGGSDDDTTDALLGEVFESVRSVGDEYVSPGAVSDFMDHTDDVAVFAKMLVFECLARTPDFRSRTSVDLQHVYGSDKEMRPSAVLGVNDMEDIFALNTIRTLDPTNPHHIIFVANRVLEMQFTANQIAHAASMWKEVTETVFQETWVRESFQKASMMIEMQRERAAGARRTPGEIEGHAMRRVRLSDRLSKSASRILLYYRMSDVQMGDDDVIPLTNEEMRELEQEWMRVDWSELS